MNTALKVLLSQLVEERTLLPGRVVFRIYLANSRRFPNDCLLKRVRLPFIQRSFICNYVFVIVAHWEIGCWKKLPWAELAGLEVWKWVFRSQFCRSARTSTWLTSLIMWLSCDRKLSLGRWSLRRKKANSLPPMILQCQRKYDNKMLEGPP